MEEIRTDLRVCHELLNASKELLVRFLDGIFIVPQQHTSILNSAPKREKERKRIASDGNKSNACV